MSLSSHQKSLAKEFRDAIAGSPDPALIRWVVLKIIEYYANTNVALDFIKEVEK